MLLKNKRYFWLILAVSIIGVIVLAVLWRMNPEGTASNKFERPTITIKKVKLIKHSNSIAVTFATSPKSKYTISDLKENQLSSGISNKRENTVSELKPSSSKLAIRVKHNNNIQTKVVSVPIGYHIMKSAISRKPIPMGEEFKYNGKSHVLFSMTITPKKQNKNSIKNTTAFNITVKNDHYLVPVVLDTKYLTVSDSEGNSLKVKPFSKISIPAKKKKTLAITIEGVPASSANGLVITYNTVDLDLPISFINS